MQYRFGQPFNRLTGMGLLLCLCLLMTGCQLGGWVVYTLNGTQKEKIPAQYDDLKNQRFAVLVSADANTLYQSPEATRSICTAVTRELADKVAGSKPLNPKQVIQFQDETPYWTTVPYNRLLKQLDVDRLVIIDVVQYNIHEKGNASVFKGTAIANVSVAKSSDEDLLAFSKVVKATYPVGSELGLLKTETDEQTFRLALLLNLSQTIGRMFYEYEIQHE